MRKNEYTELAVEIGRLMGRAEELTRDNASLRSALAEKTAQVERLREALEKAAKDFVSANGTRPEWWVSVLDLYQDNEALATTADTPRPTCAWTYDDSTSSWDSACGEKWQFIDGGPEENGVKFCHGCGRPVRV